jgi:hypothetical protein
MLKKLTIEDLESVKKILPLAKVYEFKETYLSELAFWYAFGYYDNDQLKGIACAYFSGDLPEWELLAQYCDDSDDLIKMLDEVCERFEKNKLFKFSWVDLDYSMDFIKNFVPSRYYSFKEYETEAWQKPRYRKHAGTLYNSGWYPVKSSVYYSILKNEDRSF